MIKELQLKLWLLAFLLLGGSSYALAEETTATITFGNNGTKINDASVTGDDSQDNTWTITTVGTTSFTQNAAYSQVGSSNKPATSITFTTTLASDVTITSFSANFGGFSGTAGTVTLKVGDTTVGTGSLSASSDVTVSSTSQASGKVLTVTVTGIAKGVKAYNISYTYATGPVKTPIATLNGISPTELNVGDNDEFTLDATFASSDPTDYEITWSCEETDVLFIAGILYEGMSAGTAHVTVSVEPVDDETYTAVTKTFEVTVIDPNAKGGKNNPYTVAEARGAIDAGTGVTGVYARGIVSKIVTAYNSQYGNISYNISDDGSETADQLLAYRGKSFNGDSFTSADDIQVGDVVVVYGDLIKFNSTYEFAQDNQLVERSSKELTEIVLSGEYPTTFVEGSEFNHDGIEVTAYFTDGSMQDATSAAQFSVPDMTQIGNQEVSVTYTVGENTATAVYTITITEAPTHNVTFHINGNVQSESLKQGAEITFPAVPESITDKEFVGWTTTEIATPTDTKPEFVASAVVGSEDMNFYAVYAKKQSTGGYSLTMMRANDTFADGDKVVVVATDDTDVDETQYGLYQETVSNSYVKNFVFENDAMAISQDDKKWFTVTEATDGWYLGDDTNGYLYTSGSNNLAVVTSGKSVWTLTWDSENEKFKLISASGRPVALRTDLTGDNHNKWRLSSGVSLLDIYKYEVTEDVYVGYTTNISKTYTVTFVNVCHSSWGDNVYIHAWNFEEGNATGDWPGVACTQTGTVNVYGYDFPVYTCTFTSSITPKYVMFNNGDMSDNGINIKQTLGNAFVDGATYRNGSDDPSSQNWGSFFFTDDANQFKPAETYNIDYMYGELGSVTYARMFTSGKLSTIVLPFDLPADNASAAGKFYEVSSIAGGWVHGVEVTEPEAYKPYIFMPSDNPWFTNIQLHELPAYTNKSITTSEGYVFEYVTEETDLVSGGEYDYYGFSDGKFVKAANAKAKPFRAYFKVAHSANAPETLQWFDDSTTGISTLKSDVKNGKAEVYDMQGRRVLNPVRGLYIVNGKKVVVK